MRGSGIVLAVALLGTPALGAPTPEQKCEIAKTQGMGKLAACIQKVRAKAIAKGTTPDFVACLDAHSTAWDKAEAKAVRAGTECIDEIVSGQVAGLVTASSETIGNALAGGALFTCGNGAIDPNEECDTANLNGATCETELPNVDGASGTLACTPFCLFDVSGCATHAQCSEPYYLLDDPTRNVAFSDGDDGVELCDAHPPEDPQWRGPGWYRMAGGAGVKLPESAPQPFACGTDAGGWLTSAHPTVAEGVVAREVCFAFMGAGCFDDPTPIQVVNCGSYYLYNLADPAAECFRYCAEGVN